jgi:uncharacterized protein YdbL (DUF1318 family)
MAKSAKLRAQRPGMGTDAMNRLAHLAVCALALLIIAATPLLAGPLDDAKAAGQVGEQADGYVGLVDANAPPAARQLVDDVNARRQAKYAEIAAKRGVSVEAVAQITGEKLIGRAGAGEHVRGADGSWRQK